MRIFAKIGYYVAHQEGSHLILYNDQDGYPPLSIPNHKELAPGLLSAQIKKAGLTVQAFNALRKKRKG